MATYIERDVRTVHSVGDLAAFQCFKMPKLHFYDTGLVCWLLGIRSPAN